MYNDITGIILSGGKSSRMGQNKALMQFQGETIIERMVKLMKSIFSRVVLITNTPDEYTFLNLETFTDFYACKGPLAGIHSGLVNSQTEKNFIISCDIPLINTDVINYICEFKTKKPITISKGDGYLQHLCGVYQRRILPYAADILMSTELMGGPKACNIHNLSNEMGAEIIDASKIPGYFEGMFLNLNKAEDYEQLITMSESFNHEITLPK